MRFSTVFIAVLSATAQAIAVAVAEDGAAKREADPWCLFHGQGCWKRDTAAPAPAAISKREAAPVAEADPWCLFHGEGCWKREAAANADPEADPWCLFHGEGCWKEKREASPVPAPEADPEADPWCLFHGEGCWKEKREAAPAPEADPEAWCLFHGESCWKVKRAAYAFANAIRGAAGVKESRSADVSNMVGGAAYNAKRAVSDIATMIAGRTSEPPEFIKQLFFLTHFGPDANLTTSAPYPPYGPPYGPPETTTTDAATDAAPERRSVDDASTTDATRRWCLFHGQGCWKRDAAPWCLFHGEGCWKRAEPMSKREAEADPYCLFHGEGCWKEKRDDRLSAREASPAASPAFFPFASSDAAGSVGYASKRDFAAADKRACNLPGEACDLARRAAEALVSEIEGQNEVRDAGDVEARWCLFHGEGCWKRDGMDEVVARCNAEGGACSQAKRDLEAMHTAARGLLEYLDEE